MNSPADNHDRVVACPECDLVQRVAVNALPAGATLRCRRCNRLLFRYPGKPLDHAVAWSLAGLILLVLANAFPIIDLLVNGQQTQTSLFSGAVALSRAGQFEVAALVVAVLVVAPALLFVLQIGIFLPLQYGRIVPHFPRLMRLLSAVSPWLMFDVFMLAILVAVVKLSHLADVSPGWGLWAFVGLMGASIASLTVWDRHCVWARYSALSEKTFDAATSGKDRVEEHRQRSVRAWEWVSCASCGLINTGEGSGVARCRRCGAVLHRRKADSLGRTWALLIAAYILLIPANLLPITITKSLFGVQADTIMSGVAYFWYEGAYDLAVIIFTASVFVPLAKLMALSFLAFSARQNTHRDPMQCTRLYRMVEFVGKWSMLDVFVVALLAQLVQFSSLASIDPGPGAMAFAAVVIITMFAAMSFDPRLLWDSVERHC